MVHVHPHPIEHLEEHVTVPEHWGSLTHSETPFISSKMHPTKMHFHDAHNNRTLEWNSRRHRKHRNFIVRHPDTGERIREPGDTHKVRGKKFWAWDFKNISWWVAQCFLWGSCFWVINGFAVWLQPFNNKRTADDLARISALVGGAIFLIGASLAYLEALNVHPRADKFVPDFFLEHHNTAIKAHKNKQGQKREDLDTTTAGSPFPSEPASPTAQPATPQSHNSPSSETDSNRGSGVSDPDANAAAVSSASEKLARRMSIKEEKRKSRALRNSLQLPPDTTSPAHQSAPTTGSTPPAASPASLAPPQTPAEDPDSPQTRARAFSIVSDSYNPNTSNAPSRRSSVSSYDDASSSYDSENPDRVPTSTPPASPKPVPKEEENEEEKLEEPDFKAKGSRWRDLGYLAAVSQLCGASIFFISCVTGMHGTINENSVGQVQGLYWAPQVVGAMGFVIAGMLLMYEVQPNWWHIQLKNTGWHVGFWNWLGAIGFALCGIFGFYAFAGWGQEWGTAYSTFWGAWAFLIGSYVQFLEAINK